MTRTGRSRLEHRQGWLDAGWSSVTGAMDGGRGPCPVAGGTRPTTKDGLVSPEPRMAGGDLVFRPALCKQVKAEFGYDDRIGVGACYRGPSWAGNARFGYDSA
ncbi:MAG TPA: hypothetical protein VMW91_05820 [Desulfosporosinus sp.]|nr:hypothetical protein [Desulfosporosinus sp.]